MVVFMISVTGDSGEHGSRLSQMTSGISEGAIDRSQRWCSQRLPESVFFWSVIMSEGMRTG